MRKTQGKRLFYNKGLEIEYVRKKEIILDDLASEAFESEDLSHDGFGAHTGKFMSNGK